MADNPNKPSNSESLPPNNNPLLEQAANHGPATSNPVKQGAGDAPKTEKEATDFQKSESSSSGGLMDKAKSVMDSASKS